MFKLGFAHLLWSVVYANLALFAILKDKKTHQSTRSTPDTSIFFVPFFVLAFAFCFLSPELSFGGLVWRDGWVYGSLGIVGWV